MPHDREASAPSAASLLFAYGTLGPVAGDSASWVADRLRGRLFDLGPYPVLVGWDDPGAGWVEGHVRPVSPVELKVHLDPYEGVDEGLFRRLVLVTEAGRAVWVYVYPHPVPRDARGPLPRWDRSAGSGPWP